ncbi:polypeptide N-acetylgalactosaminyltransferase 5-like isoform X2 [Dreissena polymorpha]|uniref:polypeptide N-acetylgalactosaminyltransferase 5-like isoform X2 n=1 Tax=Dreissena polymorpha TaxID=45954 RepID=UPI0022643351|nr:polypeptide N-acetylgalactosaminyltransferase 5-like isoform X2 [Dreissena polymorpha]
MLPSRHLKRLTIRLGAVVLLIWTVSLTLNHWSKKEDTDNYRVKEMDIKDGHLAKIQENLNRLKQSNDEERLIQRDIAERANFGNDKLEAPPKRMIEHNKDSAIVKTVNIMRNNDLKDTLLERRENENVPRNIDADKNEHPDGKKEDKQEDVAQIGAPVPRREGAEQKDGPGEGGKPVYIDKEKLTKEQRDDFDKGYQDNAFNRYASDMISLHRSLPDLRETECKKIQYGNHLPSACVIIIFHNEAWSVLLRTIHSVLDRSDPTQLKEIIVVDDFSDFDHLKQPLQEYIDKQDKVSLLRAHERIGLIRARLMGFEKCTADVAIFLDSHCEATEGWLPPLLSRIHENETNVLVPVIDVIDLDTFGYQGQVNTDIKSVYVGGFDWGLLFNWHPIPQEELKRIEYKTYLPVRSPTMAGGLFAISSKFFRKLGTYDSGFDIWGGENLELSFKTWMCGGTLETIPCSRVGHVFRKRSPYKWDVKGGNVLRRNLVRLAEVWLDDYKEYYLQRINYDKGDYGDVSDRKALRESLHCKSFQWYLDNIFPELFVPGEALASGEIRNVDRSMCIDASTNIKDNEGVVSVYPCHQQGGNQFWLLSKEGEFRRDDTCWDTPDGAKVKLYPCHTSKGNQLFEYREDNTIYSPTVKKCVEITWDAKGLQMAPCTGNDRQKWKMMRKPPKGPGHAEKTSK